MVGVSLLQPFCYLSTNYTFTFCQGCPFIVDVTEEGQFNVNLSQCELFPIGKKAKFTVSSKSPIQPDSIKVTINCKLCCT